jgi:hypothetical protein
MSVDDVAKYLEENDSSDDINYDWYDSDNPKCFFSKEAQNLCNKIIHDTGRRLDYDTFKKGVAEIFGDNESSEPAGNTSDDPTSSDEAFSSWVFDEITDGPINLDQEPGEDEDEVFQRNYDYIKGRMVDSLGMSPEEAEDYLNDESGEHIGAISSAIRYSDENEDW